LHEISNYLKTRFRLFLILLLAFLAGCLFTGLFLNRHRFADIGELVNPSERNVRDLHAQLMHGKAV